LCLRNLRLSIVGVILGRQLSVHVANENRTPPLHACVLSILVSAKANVVPIDAKFENLYLVGEFRVLRFLRREKTMGRGRRLGGPERAHVVTLWRLPHAGRRGRHDVDVVRHATTVPESRAVRVVLTP
jgi:hypothetical protein